MTTLHGLMTNCILHPEGVGLDRESAIKNILYSYEEASFIACDPAKVLALMSDTVNGIALGGQSTLCSKANVAEFVHARLVKKNMGICAISYGDISICFPCASCATLLAKINLRHTKDGEIVSSSFMQSLTLVEDGGVWSICQFHASPILISLENTELSPQLFPDIIRKNLQSQITTEAFDLMSASFVGGVVGMHQRGDKYPLYFANEGIARFLGYSLEEFYQVFQDDVAQILYADDYEYVMKLTADVLQRNQDVYARMRLQKKDGSLLPVIDYARKIQDSEGNDILVAVFTDISELVELHEKLEKQNNTILSSIRYASKIQKNMLPALSCFKEFFSDAHVLWKPKDIVGGDFYWLKKFDEGAVLAVCDCTGHGIPGALITMLVRSILDSIVTPVNYQDTAQVLLLLDKKIAEALSVHSAISQENKKITHIDDGCDIAIVFVANDGAVRFSSAGIHIFVCDGKTVTQHKGQRLFVGTGALTDNAQITTTDICMHPDNSFYIASDGLYDQIGASLSRPFGYSSFKKIICDNHAQGVVTVSEKLWEAFEQHRGAHCQRDDVELICFRP